MLEIIVRRSNDDVDKRIVVDELSKKFNCTLTNIKGKQIMYHGDQWWKENSHMYDIFKGACNWQVMV